MLGVEGLHELDGQAVSQSVDGEALPLIRLGLSEHLPDCIGKSACSRSAAMVSAGIGEMVMHQDCPRPLTLHVS